MVKTIPIRAAQQKNIEYFMILLNKRDENAIIGTTKLANSHK
jgi:hypothetical protein